MDDFFDIGEPIRPLASMASPAEVLRKDLERTMNPEQLNAVLNNQGPLLVLAGAGSGKTRVITHKIAWLVEAVGLMPWQILAVTFTNKAAAEMRERTEKLLGERAKDTWIGTFHSTGLRLLRRHAELVGRTRDFVVYDQDDRERLLGKVMKELNVDKEYLSPKKASYYIDDQAHLLRGPGHPELPMELPIDKTCAKVYAAYEDAKTRANAFDFSDLIVKTVQLFEKHPPVLSEWQYKWRYVMVDEFQDTDRAQSHLLRLLAGDAANLCVVGDDDQSSYRWRGADVRNILDFPDTFPGREVAVVRLERNYRSMGNILKAASSLIRRNTARHDKSLWTEKPAGELIRVFAAETEGGEARWVLKQLLDRRRAGTPLNEVAVFYRTHSQSRVFEDVLRMEALPYIVVGGLKFYERKEVKDVLAYLRLVHNPADDVALLRVIDSPPRGIGDKTLERVAELGSATGTSLFEAMELFAQSREGSRSRAAIERFRGQVQGLRVVAERNADALAVARAVLEDTGFADWIKKDTTLEGQGRRENVDELMLSIEEWRARNSDRSLTAFIDHVSLLTSLDQDARGQAVTLMTVHAAKGLEFDTVFVTGLEEEVFPHFNSKEEAALEEERRLAYVAITRGKERVYLSYARSRQRFGRTDVNMPSRFLGEIDPTVLKPESEFGGSRAFSGSAGWTHGATSRPSVRPDLSTLQGLAGRSTGGGWAASASKASSGSSASSASASRPSHGRSLDYADSQVGGGGGELVGRQVVHPRFGRGKVLKVEGNGEDARVTVKFPMVGEKTIIARFLQAV